MKNWIRLDREKLKTESKAEELAALCGVWKDESGERLYLFKYDGKSNDYRIAFNACSVRGTLQECVQAFSNIINEEILLEYKQDICLENKQEILDLLLPTLKVTRNLSDLKHLKYDKQREEVVVIFENGTR